LKNKTLLNKTSKLNGKSQGNHLKDLTFHGEDEKQENYMKEIKLGL